jgi:hypothetical protein
MASRFVAGTAELIREFGQRPMAAAATLRVSPHDRGEVTCRCRDGPRRCSRPRHQPWAPQVGVRPEPGSASVVPQGRARAWGLTVGLDPSGDSLEAAYRRLHTVLAAQLGVDPGPEARRPERSDPRPRRGAAAQELRVGLTVARRDAASATRRARGWSVATTGDYQP